MPAEMVDGAANATATPRSFPVQAAYPYSLTTVQATFDGSGAGGDFLPVLAVYTQDGKLAGRYGVDQAVTAGDTAQVTYSPFSRGSGGGIKFNRVNTGGWLGVTTTTTGGPGGGGVNYRVTTGEFGIDVLDAGTGAFRVNAPSITLDVGVTGTIDFVADLADFQVNDFNVAAGNSLVIAAGGGTESISATGSFTFELPAGETLTVLDSGGNPIFRVDENGDLHGLAGKALTFDL